LNYFKCNEITAQFNISIFEDVNVSRM